jgi:hypothetical protein
VKRVRGRDARCCIKGDLVAGEDYTGFEAAHIFPLNQREIVSILVALMLIFFTSLQWNDLNCKRFIEDDEIEAGFD